MQDENGVDLASAIAHFTAPDVSIGGLSHSIVSRISTNTRQNSLHPAEGPGDSFEGGLGYSVPENHGGDWDYRASFSVSAGGLSETFFINGDGSLESTRGGTLSLGTASATSFDCLTNWGIWTYTAGDGTVALIDTSISTRGSGVTGWASISASPGTCGVVTQITRPDGAITRINWRRHTDPANRIARIQSVTRNDGFQLKYLYSVNGAIPSPTSIIEWRGFWGPLGVVGVNNAFAGCDALADTCALAGSWPQSSYVWSGPNDTVLSVVDQAGATTRFTMDQDSRVAAVMPAGSTVDRISYQYCPEAASDCTPSANISGPNGPILVDFGGTDGRVRRVIRDGQTWDYYFPLGNSGIYQLVYRSTDPHGHLSVATSSILGTGALLVFGSEAWGYANYENSPRNRMLSGQFRGGPPETYTYDARGNITSDGITSVSFDTTCANIRTCNRPNWTRDVAGNQTDYTYDPVHGGVLTITAPAVNGVRPQTRYAYVQRYAWYRNANGTMVRSTEPIWKLASESSCRTSAASGAGCATAGDEVVTTYDYGPDSGPNNLLVRGMAVTADGQSLRTCYGYDQYGNRVSETQPRAGLTSCP